MKEVFLRRIGITWVYNISSNREGNMKHMAATPRRFIALVIVFLIIITVIGLAWLFSRPAIPFRPYPGVVKTLIVA
jgi:hypothetical protein